MGRKGDRVIKGRPKSKTQRLRSKVSPSPHLPIVPSHLRPSKSLGQNFLINEGVVSRTIEALSPASEETIIEIGSGRGALTTQLLNKAGRVIAIEFDRHLIPVLHETFAARENFTLLAADALFVDFCSVINPATHARVVANLPYNIATAILQRLIAQRRCTTEMVLMLQKEVVDRLVASHGSKERGYISVFVEAYCETEKLFDVAPGSFRPAPKVWSSVIRLKLKLQPALAKNEKLLWQLVSAGFAQRRKTILNNLRGAPPELLELIKGHGGASIILCEAGIDLQRRAETITLEEWLRLVRMVGN
ncbi:MAG: 16S rRNA (adenine(1518)-N(6)/adenine(1519)-N(6))-dimethyltransferase RsmA [Pyrinomonadaceae bacterium]